MRQIQFWEISDKRKMKLLSIRSSDIAFTMGAYGRLLEESIKHEFETPGDWGNGEDQEKRLTEAGYDYDKVQRRVNELI